MQAGSGLGALCAALLVAYAGTAMAKCDEQLDAANGRLNAIAEQESHDNEKGEAKGGHPAEGWFGSSASAKSAKSLLDNARELARNGKDDGCMSLVAQANRIIDGLGGPKPAKAWDGPGKPAGSNEKESGRESGGGSNRPQTRQKGGAPSQ